MNLTDQQNHFKELVKLMEHTLFKKGDDYANEDRLSNFKDSGAITGMNARQICLNLIAVKVSRLGNLFKSNNPKNESVNDSILDLANYAVLLHMITNEGKFKDITKQTKHQIPEREWL